MTITATPLMMPNRKPVLLPTVEVVYTTATGDKPRPTHRDRTATVLDDADRYDPYCFVCQRVTDHVGEHEMLVGAGLARYDGNGTVSRTDKWDEEQARLIAEAEYQSYRAQHGF